MATRVIKDRLYRFFITDHETRTRAFGMGSLVGISAGLIFTFAGAPPLVSGIVSVIASIGMFSASALRYALHSPITAKANSRRPLLRLAFASFSAWLFDVTFSSQALMFYYAEESAAALRGGKNMSILMLMLARISAASKLEATPAETRLMAAYGTFTSAQIYQQIKDMGLSKNIVSGLQFYLAEDSPGFAGLAGGDSMLFDDVSVFGQIRMTKPLPHFIETRGNPKIIVKNCKVYLCSQNLDGIAFFDVRFEQCVFTSMSGKLLMVNVSMINCRLANFPSEIDARVRRACGNGNATNINLVIQPELLQ